MKKRSCCQKCCGSIVVSYLYQTSHDYKLNKNGKLSKRYTRSVECSMEVAIAACLDCGAYWDADSFDIDEDGSFWDMKYVED